MGYPEGVGVIISCLKKAGHEVRLLYINEHFSPLDHAQIQAVVEEYNPGLILFSTGSNQFPYTVEIAKGIKSWSSVPIIVGGHHLSMNPSDFVGESNIDIMCIGEGEEAVVELANSLETGKDITKIRNLWVRRNEEIFKNPVRPFVDLNTLPYADRETFEFHKMIDLKNGWVDVMAGRGCPYRCTYCFNENYHNIYKGDLGSGCGRYIRYRNPEAVIGELLCLLRNYEGVQMFRFNDDTFAMKQAWTTQFCSLYKEQIPVPFYCNGNVNSLTPEIIASLSSAKCDGLAIGVECANERIRRKILRRAMGTDKIVKTLKMVREAGIKVSTYNMIGLPTETKDDIMDTLRLNVECSVDIIRIFTFYPYKNTPIYETCRELDLLDPEAESMPNYFEKSILNLPPSLKSFVEDVQQNLCLYLNDLCRHRDFKYETRFTPYFAVKVPK